MKKSERKRVRQERNLRKNKRSMGAFDVDPDGRNDKEVRNADIEYADALVREIEDDYAGKVSRSSRR